MERRITSWFSQNLQMEMPLVAYGHAGQTLLMLPTAAADYLEYERFYLVDAIKPLIEQGRIRAYSINSVNRWSLLNEQMPPNLKAELLTRYDRYITEEVLPLIRNENKRFRVCGSTWGRSAAGAHHVIDCHDYLCAAWVDAGLRSCAAFSN